MQTRKFSSLAGFVLLVGLHSTGQGGVSQPKSELLIGAASSMTDVLQEISTAFKRDHPNVNIQFTFASSGLLARQIANGAPIDLFIAASPAEIETITKSGKSSTNSAITFANNRLVMIAPKESKLRRIGDIGTQSIKRIAIGNPDTVPAGRYAKEMLVRRKLWKTVEAKLVFAENVRQTLAYVAAGNVNAGFVYSTDAIREPRIRIVEIGKEGSDHAPIQYFAATTSANTEAISFQRYLTTSGAQTVLKKFGFLPPPETRHAIRSDK